MKISNFLTAMTVTAGLMVGSAGLAATGKVPAGPSGSTSSEISASDIRAMFNADVLASMNYRTSGPLVESVARDLNVETVAVASLNVNVAPATEFTTMLAIDGQAVTLNLQPYSNLAPDFKLIVQDDTGYHEVDPGPIRTLRGTIREFPNSVVAATLADEGLYARIIMDNGQQFWVEPLSIRVADAAIDDHAIYRGENVKPVGTCGTHAEHGVDLGVRPNTERGAPSVAQIGCDSDFEFFQFWGSVAAVNTRIQNIVNTINIQYDRDVNITHAITAILVRSTSTDPYSSTGSINTLLNEVGNHWNSSQGAITRDVVQMFTARSITQPAGVIGLASVGVVCNISQAYSVVWSTCCGSFASTTDLSAHELGHNWNSVHCSCPSFTMNPSLTGANIFATESINQIVAFRNTRGCLNAGGPAPATTPNPSSGAVNVPLTQSVNWANGGGATSYDVYFGTDPTPDADSGNSELIGNQAALFYDPPGNLVMNTTYYWRIDARNAAGVTPGPVWSFATPPPPPGNFNLLSPADGASIATSGPLLDWSIASSVSFYRLEFADNASFVNRTTFNNLPISQLQTSNGTFTQGQTYWWRVYAIGSTGVETLGTPASSSFTVSPPGLPSAAISPTPANGATNVSVMPSLGWANGGGATSYDVYFGTDPTPDETEFVQNQTAVSYNPGELVAGETYYWRIDARNAVGPTTGAIWSFTTIPPNCPGDANGDGNVNGADLSVVLGNFGTKVTPGSSGDFNNDGFVNGADLSVLLGAFGTSC